MEADFIDIEDTPIYQAEALSLESLSDILSPPPMEDEEEDEEPEFVKTPVRNSLAFFNSAVPVRKASFSRASIPMPNDLAALGSPSNSGKKGASNNEWKEMENYIKVREKAKDMEMKAQLSNRVETNSQSKANPGRLNTERTKLFTDTLPSIPIQSPSAPPKLSPSTSLRGESPKKTSPNSSLRGESPKAASPTSSLRGFDIKGSSPNSSLRNSPPSSPHDGKSSPKEGSPSSSPRLSISEKKLSNSSFQISELDLNHVNLKITQTTSNQSNSSNNSNNNSNNNSFISLRKSSEVSNPNLSNRPLPVPRPIVPALLGSTQSATISSHRISGGSPPSTIEDKETNPNEAMQKKSSSRLFDKKMSLESGKYESDNSSGSSNLGQNPLISPRPTANSKSSSLEKRNMRRVGSNLSETSNPLTRSASMDNPSSSEKNSERPPENVQKMSENTPRNQENGKMDRGTILFPYKSEDPRILSLEAGVSVQIVNDNMGENWIQISCDGKIGLYPRKFVRIGEIQNKVVSSSVSLDSLPALRESSVSLPISLRASNDEDKSSSKDKSKDDKKKSKEKEKKKEKKGGRKRESEFDANGEDDILLREGTKKTWRGSTVERIIGKLCSSDDEQNLALTFSNSWSSLLSADELLELLKERAKVMSRRTMMSEDIKNTAAPIVLKIIEFMKLWLKADLPMLTQTGMIQKIKSFVDELALYQPVAANRILDEELGGISGKSKLSRTASLKWKPLKMSLSVESFSSIEDIDPEELARQMTLIEHSQLSNISAAEFIKQRWVKGKTEDAPVIHAMAESFNQTSGWISTLILTPLEVDQRAIMLSRWIYMAKTFYELGNFNGVLEVLSSLNSSAVFRLRQTWELLPPKSVSIFNSLNKIMNPEFHYSAYKDALKKCHPPVVPHMGLTLTDLLMIDEGNPTFLPENNFVNIGKLELLSNNIKDIITFARQPYSLLKHDKIYEFLMKEKHVEDERQLYDMSLQREERKKKPPKRQD